MKRKIQLFTSIIAIIAATSCSHQKESLSVRIDGWNNDTILFLTFNHSTNQDLTDTIIANNGEVVYNFEGNDTIEFIMLNKRTAVGRPFSSNQAKEVSSFILPNSKESIEGVAYDNRVEYTSSGSIDMFKDAAEIRLKTLSNVTKQDSLNYIIDSYTHYPRSKEERDIYNNLFTQRKEYGNKNTDIKIEYLLNNTNSQLSGIYATLTPYEECREYIDMLSTEVRNGIFKRNLDRGYERATKYMLIQEAKKSIVKGVPAPQFTLTGIDGKEVNLSDYKGKWIVLDFWGSWCGWCIKDIPEMKKAYEKYRGKVEFIGINCNEGREPWLEAVKQHKLPWVNVINKNNMEDDVALKYAVEGYPTKIIIDPEQNIYKIVSQTSIASELEVLVK